MEQEETKEISKKERRKSKKQQPISQQIELEESTQALLKELSESEVEVFKQIKHLFTTEYKELLEHPQNVNFINDRCYLRFLRARDFDLEKSSKMLEATLTWRKDFEPENITFESIKGIHDLGGFYRNGHDKLGRPILYIKPGAYNPFPAEDRVKYLVWMMETTIKSMDPGTEKITWILDFSDYGKRAKSPEGRVVAQNSQHILQNHFPERLASLFVVNAPWFFWFLYTLVSPFLETKTKQKIKFVNGSKEDLAKSLSEFIELDQLEEKYGGTNTSPVTSLTPTTPATSLTPTTQEETSSN